MRGFPTTASSGLPYWLADPFACVLATNLGRRMSLPLLVGDLGPTASGINSSFNSMWRNSFAERLSAATLSLFIVRSRSAPRNPLRMNGARAASSDLTSLVRRINHRGRLLATGKASHRRHLLARTFAVVVGGSGLYLRALIEGLFSGPVHRGSRTDAYFQRSH